MSKRVKIAIAAVIIVALLVLVVLDRNTSTSRPQEPQTAADEGESIFETARRAADLRTTVEEFLQREAAVPPEPEQDTAETEFPIADDLRDLRNLTPPVIRKLKGRGPAPSEPERIKATEQEDVEVPAPPVPVDAYVVMPGDSFYKIAEKKYGNGSLWKVIQRANPEVKPYPLRVGQKLKIPRRPVLPKTPVEKVVHEDGRNVYTVQPGDTLSGISQKVYRTIKHADGIFDLNRDQLASPHELVVGQKLVLPDVAPREISSTPRRQEIPAGAKVHTVQPGDSLWKIAERYRGGKGILERMDEIVEANSGRLASVNTMLKLGWTLVIPD
ncbi:MAG: LysM peptidoglycan-binding domain-containing protein [Planctomycetota bacterium]|jgi:nucleoid-associated protein YgaU